EVVLRVLYFRAWPRRLPPLAQGEHGFLVAQPGNGRLLQRIPRDPVPECHDLLPGFAPAAGAQLALRESDPAGRPGAGGEGIAPVHAAPGSLRTAGWDPEALP